MAKRYFTSEAVGMGHPDKLADRISDSVLDACLAQDPASRVACETMVTTGVAVVAGEITTKAQLDYQEIVRGAINRVGYTDDEFGINGKTCAVMVALDKQSPDIKQGVDDGAKEDFGRPFFYKAGKVARETVATQSKEAGAGDQGLMFGYACNQTKEFMPLPIALAHRITNRLSDLRFAKAVDWLRPDSKSQVTVEYDGDKPVRIAKVVVSTQHDPKVDQNQIAEWIVPNCVIPCLDQNLIDDKTEYYVNPTGNFVVGGPNGDCGLTGRKIIVDTYGGWARHGGGAFSGKDPSKVDRSAAYMARYIAKNVVAANLADSCEVQLAYAIGVSEPISVMVDLGGTGKVDEQKVADAVREIFPLTPGGLVAELKLRRPIYEKTSFGGHFGRGCDAFSWEKEVGVSCEDDAYFTWEKTDKAAELAKLL